MKILKGAHPQIFNSVNFQVVFINMKGLLLSAFICLISIAVSFGQCTVRGKVTDENGEVIIGATVVLKSNSSVGAASDFEGNYTIQIPDDAPQSLIVSYISYQTVEEIIHPLKGRVIIKNFDMHPATQSISEVVVVGKAVKANTYYMENVKKKSATSIDYVSSETMKKTGDVNVTSAVARVPGVSTTSNGFFNVRGIGDRYIKTAINGSRIPTLDPFTNNIKLDLFPASLVDNVVITKTASPDLPGDWAGAYLSIETKDYPDKLEVNAEVSAGYNAQTTFKDVISSERSSTDWLGYDNGFRDHDLSSFASANLAPGQYQQLIALGLGPFYSSMGITGWTDNSAIGNTYFKLGLIQLGLLAPAQFNDQSAFNTAKSLYLSGPYQSEAFNIINANVAKTGQSFPDNWNTTTRQAPLNFSQSFSVGNQIKLFGKPFGYIFGYRYRSNIQYDPNSTTSRAKQSITGRDLSTDADQQISKETNGWSALLNLAYKLNPNNSVSLLFMPNFTGVNNVRSAHDFDVADISTIAQYYEERRQLVYQLKTEHYLPATKVKIESNASYTQGKSSVPDFIYFQYGESFNGKDTVYSIGPDEGAGVNRYYRFLTDNLFDSRLSFELPLGNSPTAGIRKLKLGGSYQNDQQRSDRYDFSLQSGPGPQSPQNGNWDQYFSLDQFAINNSNINWYYQDDPSPANHSFGRSSQEAGFAMVDYSFIPKLRFAGGLRVEHANIYTDIDKFDSLGYAPNDPRRDYNINLPPAQPGKLDEVDFLPSANIIYKLKDDELSPINLRLNYSRTVARPSVRELSAYAVLDYELNAVVFGNPDLKTVQINNYDLRAESYFKNGDNLSVSLFYKQFYNDIELVQYSNYSWQNADKSSVKGIEFEGRKMLTKKLDLRANVTFVNSSTTVDQKSLQLIQGIATYIPIDTVTRSMFGQAPYVVNGILTYTADSLGLVVALSYNVQGARLAIATSLPGVIPDVYELPRNVLDCKVTKKLSKHFSASFTVRDILNAPIIRAYKYPDGWSILPGQNNYYDKYTYGTNYLLGLSYKL